MLWWLSGALAVLGIIFVIFDVIRQVKRKIARKVSIATVFGVLAIVAAVVLVVIALVPIMIEDSARYEAEENKNRQVMETALTDITTQLTSNGFGLLENEPKEAIKLFDNDGRIEFELSSKIHGRKRTGVPTRAEMLVKPAEFYLCRPTVVARKANDQWQVGFMHGTEFKSFAGNRSLRDDYVQQACACPA